MNMYAFVQRCGGLFAFFSFYDRTMGDSVITIVEVLSLYCMALFSPFKNLLYLNFLRGPSMQPSRDSIRLDSI